MRQNSALVRRGLPVLTAVAIAAVTSSYARAETIIELTQTGCQFVESESGVDHMYETASKADCNAINAKTASERLASAKVLELKPGRYVFRVTNKNVPYDLGFWLREEGYDWRNPLHKLSKISVSGGGLGLGKTRDYEVELKPGAYVYSCPLNPTLDYKLIVTEG